MKLHNCSNSPTFCLFQERLTFAELSWQTFQQDGGSTFSCCILILYNSWRLGCQLWSGSTAPGLAVRSSLVEETVCKVQGKRLYSCVWKCLCSILGNYSVRIVMCKAHLDIYLFWFRKKYFSLTCVMINSVLSIFWLVGSFPSAIVGRHSCLCCITVSSFVSGGLLEVL